MATATITPRLRIEFDPEAHAYLLNSEPVKSVTQVLELEGLSGSVWYTEDARRRGTAVHKVALLLSKRAIRGTTPEEIVSHSLWDPSKTAPALVPYGFSLASFLAESGFRPQLAEGPVASARLRLAGTLDAFGTLPDGRTLLVDYKSGPPQAAAWLQVALYAAMLEETHGIKPDLRTVVWLKPDGTYKTWPYRPAGGQDLAIATCAVSLYHWRAANNKLG